uniref:Uncharacterized protein n=1 Tax=Chromera velia CCMP2878 TaxID=1169474 RepID=A0A0G4GH88_9ALVE|eukprot:Cvel_21900.t1-p1 / transcript=Cvel_21900.t1 / gene=Cvel_21900 / organism=Chromera_velia_CCMP2878 / gene_product=hypothetical protein / transcript_product=hypothetical protein / location=Cvel_scaffold2097:30950-33514(-) / protein_length=855 / sequence_SO=supercontig / SO=protein_coding / is_pseudo=false
MVLEGDSKAARKQETQEVSIGAARNFIRTDFRGGLEKIRAEGRVPVDSETGIVNRSISQTSSQAAITEGAPRPHAEKEIVAGGRRAAVIGAPMLLQPRPRPEASKKKAAEAVLLQSPLEAITREFLGDASEGGFDFGRSESELIGGAGRESADGTGRASEMEGARRTSFDQSVDLSLTSGGGTAFSLPTEMFAEIERRRELACWAGVLPAVAARWAKQSVVRGVTASAFRFRLRRYVEALRSRWVDRSFGTRQLQGLGEATGILAHQLAPQSVWDGLAGAEGAESSDEDEGLVPLLREWEEKTKKQRIAEKEAEKRKKMEREGGSPSASPSTARHLMVARRAGEEAGEEGEEEGAGSAGEENVTQKQAAAAAASGGLSMSERQEEREDSAGALRRAQFVDAMLADQLPPDLHLADWSNVSAEGGEASAGGTIAGLDGAADCGSRWREEAEVRMEDGLRPADLYEGLLTLERLRPEDVQRLFELFRLRKKAAEARRSVVSAAAIEHARRRAQFMATTLQRLAVVDAEQQRVKAAARIERRAEAAKEGPAPQAAEETETEMSPPMSVIFDGSLDRLAELRGSRMVMEKQLTLLREWKAKRDHRKWILSRRQRLQRLAEKRERQAREAERRRQAKARGASPSRRFRMPLDEGEGGGDDLLEVVVQGTPAEGGEAPAMSEGEDSGSGDHYDDEGDGSIGRDDAQTVYSRFSVGTSAFLSAARFGKNDPLALSGRSNLYGGGEEEGGEEEEREGAQRSSHRSSRRSKKKKKKGEKGGETEEEGDRETDGGKSKSAKKKKSSRRERAMEEDAGWQSEGPMGEEEGSLSPTAALSFAEEGRPSPSRVSSDRRAGGQAKPAFW